MQVKVSGWKAKAGSAIMLNPTLVKFYFSMTERMSNVSWLEFRFLEADTRIISGLLALRMDRTLFLLKIGYDENYSFCSPGHILIEKMIEYVYGQKNTKEINLIGDAAWPESWKLSKRAYYNLWLFPWKPLPLFMGVLSKKAKIKLRQMPVVPTVYRGIRDLIREKRS